MGAWLKHHEAGQRVADFHEPAGQEEGLAGPRLREGLDLSGELEH